MKTIDLNGLPVTFYTLCVIAAALEAGEEVTIWGARKPSHPKTAAEWLALVESINPRRNHDEI